MQPRAWRGNLHATPGPGREMCMQPLGLEGGRVCMQPLGLEGGSACNPGPGGGRGRGSPCNPGAGCGGPGGERGRPVTCPAPGRRRPRSEPGSRSRICRRGRRGSGSVHALLCFPLPQGLSCASPATSFLSKAPSFPCFPTGPPGCTPGRPPCTTACPWARQPLPAAAWGPPGQAFPRETHSERVLAVEQGSVSSPTLRPQLPTCHRG